MLLRLRHTSHGERDREGESMRFYDVTILISIQDVSRIKPYQYRSCKYIGSIHFQSTDIALICTQFLNDL